MVQEKDPITSFDRRRLLLLSLAIVVFFSLLIARFYQIQIIDGAQWEKEGDKQHYFIVKEPFMRGGFISNTSIKKGHPEVPQNFVFDVPKFHLYIDPVSISEEHRDSIAKMINSVIDLNSTEYQKLRKQFDYQTRRRKLSMWLDYDSQEAILKLWFPYARKNKIPRNALFFVSDYKRSYPFGKLLGQVLHTIQDIKDETTTQASPTGGLELYFNNYLQGKQGKRRLMRSPRNALETGEIISLPQHGANIHLTINHCLQAIAEEELEKGVKKSKAKGGWAIIMDPYTGEILALAQYPFFAPADYHHYFNDPILTENTKVKAITEANEPGSIMKPLTIAIALMANEEQAKRNAKPIFDPQAMLPTSNPNFPGRRKPLKDTHFHNFLNMDMAIWKSSNIYMARLVEKIVNELGSNWYRNALQSTFGFGLKTGIELPAESAGLLPKPGKKHPNGALEWSKGTPYTLAIGHNVQSTTMQMARAYAVIANGGFLIEPTLVRKIVQPQPDGSQKVLVDNTSQERVKKFPQVLSKKHVELVARAIKFTTKTGGTASKANIWGYTEGGKTGTGDKAINGVYDPKHVCSSFVGIAPMSKPVFVLAVAIDEPLYGYVPGVGRQHMGGACAAPVFREIGQRSLEYLGIPPDDPHGYPSSDPRYDAEKADWVPEIKQLQKIYEKWNTPHG